MKRYRYNDFIKELATGATYGVFIDDTGSPGLATTSPALHKDRKSWVAVVVPPHQMPAVLSEMPGALAELSNLTGATEFHFSEIYQGRRQFQGIDRKIRLSLFEFMGDIFQVYKFPVFVQTLDPASLEALRAKNDLPDKCGPFDLLEPQDAALLFLLIRIKSFLRSRSGLARVFVDEGFKKNGAAIRLPGFDSTFADGLICFANSASVFPIQLADFAAYTLNREQILLSKSGLDDFDVRLIEILTPVARSFQNIPTYTIRFEKGGEEWSLICTHESEPC